MRRLSDDKGFTLIELLVTLLILVVLCVGLASGIPAAVRVMKQSSMVSNADVLSSSLNTAACDVLRYSSVYVDASGNVQTKSLTENGEIYTIPLIRNDSFVDSAGNTLTEAYMTANKYVILQEDAVFGGRSAAQTNLVSAGTYTDFTVADFRLSYDVGSNVFTGSYTIQSKDGSYSKDITFSCKSVKSETVMSGS